MYRIILLVLIGIMAACGGGSSAKSPDAAIDATTVCGVPGDMGNDIGVGKYCTGLADCIADGLLCTYPTDTTDHFCTKPCSMTGANMCGMAASCQCQGGQCGCVPQHCL
jgi:hypothetical protein